MHIFTSRTFYVFSLAYWSIASASGSCSAPLFADDPLQCPDTSSFDWDHYQNSDVVVHPFQNPHVDRFNYANLRPSYDTSLFYSQSPQAGSQGQFAAVLNFTMSYPTIVIEDSAYISSCNCTTTKNKVSIDLTFADDFAFGQAYRWPGSDFVIVANNPSCSPQSDERGVYLIESIRANSYTRSVHCQGTLKSWEDVSKTLEIGVGHAHPKVSGEGSAATRVATKYWTSDGTLSSTTYLTTALPIHFSTSLTATSLKSSSLYQKPSSRPAWVPQDEPSPLSQSTGHAWSVWAGNNAMNSQASAHMSSTGYTTSSWSYPSRATASSSLTGAISTTWIARTTSATSSLVGGSSTTSSSSSSTSSGAYNTVITSAVFSNTNTTTTMSISASSSTAAITGVTNSTSTLGGSNSSSLSTTSTSSTTTSSSTSSTTTSTTMTGTSSSTTETSATTTSTTTFSDLVTFNANTTTMITTSTPSYTNSSTTVSMTSTTTQSKLDPPPSLSPTLQEMWDAIMDVLEFNADGTITFPLPESALADSNGEMPSSPFDPNDADTQEALLRLNAAYGYDTKEQIALDVRAALQEAANSEYAVTPDMNINDPAPDGYIAASMVDRSEVSDIDDPEVLSAEDQKRYFALAEQEFEDRMGGRGESDGSDSNGDGSTDESTETGSEVDTNVDTENATGGSDENGAGGSDEELTERSFDSNDFINTRNKLLALLQRREEEDDGKDQEEFTWNMVDMLGEMGCKPCEAAAKFKEVFNEIRELIGMIDFMIRQGKYRFEASAESWVKVDVPAQVLVDQWLQGNKLSCDDASFSVSSLIIDTKLLVDITNKKLIAGEITTSVTSKSNLQLKFESSGFMGGNWEFVAASLDLQTLSAPGIFRISPRFLYDFGVYYEVSAVGTVRAGANIETTNAQVSVDVGSKSVVAAKNWKPSKIDLTYPGVQPWQYAHINPYTKTTIAMHLDIFGRRFSDAIVLTTRTSIGYDEGRVFLSSSRQCQARNMKQVSTLDTLSKISVMGQSAETLYKASYPLNARCWQPAGEPTLCPEGVFDGDTYVDGGYSWQVKCGEAITVDTAYYDGGPNGYFATSLALENYFWPECSKQCANWFFTEADYGKGDTKGGCQMAVFAPQQGVNCAWLGNKRLKKIKGYGMAVAERISLVDCCAYSKVSGMMTDVNCDYASKCPDLDICTLEYTSGLDQCKVSEER